MNRSFRIGHLCTTKAFGGLEMNVLRLARWMNERAHHSIIIGRNQSPILRNACSENIDTIALDPSIPYFNISTSRKLSRIISKHRLNVLFVHTSKDINLGAMTKFISSYKFTLVFHQQMQIGYPKKDFLHSWEYNQLDAWISLLPSMKKNVLQFTNMIASNVHVIPFGIEIDQFNLDKILQLDARKEFEIPENVFVAGVIGRLDYGKGQEYLIRAINKLKNENIIVHGLIVGEATRDEKKNYAEKLFHLVDEFGLNDQIYFRPFRKNVASAFAAMDVFCLTSISETYGMVTLEAMAMQRPIIATNSAGTPDIIRDGENGILVPPQNVELLADAIKRIKSDQYLAKKLSVRARKDVKAKFIHTKQCEMLEELLNSFTKTTAR